MRLWALHLLLALSTQKREYIEYTSAVTNKRSAVLSTSKQQIIIIIIFLKWWTLTLRLFSYICGGSLLCSNLCTVNINTHSLTDLNIQTHYFILFRINQQPICKTTCVRWKQSPQYGTNLLGPKFRRNWWIIINLKKILFCTRTFN